MIRFSRKGLTVCVFGILVICLAVANAGAAKKSDKEREGLVGPVKSVTEYTAECWEQAGQWVEGPRRKERTVDYDRNGRMTRFVTYEDDGLGQDSEMTWKYDAKGRLLEETSSVRDIKSLTWTKVYRYDDDGKLIEAVYRDDMEDGIQRGVHKYDTRGNLLEEAWYYYGCSYFPDGTLASKDVFKYDEKGNRIEEAAYHGDGSLISRHKYDAQGNETEYEWASDTTGRCKYQYKYDAKGNVTEMVSYEDNGTVEYKEVYKYDASGNMVQRLHYDRGSSLTQSYTFEYVFDSHGNWIKRTRLIRVTKTGKAFWAPQQVAYRTITYY